MSTHAERVVLLLEKAENAKNTLLEATDLFHELDELLTHDIGNEPRSAKGNTSPLGLLRAALNEERRADALALRALDRFVQVLALIEQSLTNLPATVLVCTHCGATVRLTQKLAEEVERPACVACNNDLVRAPT